MTTHLSGRWLRGLASSLLALAFLLTGGCGDSGGGGGGPSPAPTITSFTTAKSPVTAGTGTTLTAVFSGGTGSVSNGVGAITSGVPVSTGNLGTSTTFVLTVTSSAGATATSTLTVNVVPAPSITSFAANPDTLAPGGTATLTAVFENGVGNVDHGIGAITSGIGTGTGAMSTTTTFRLTVSNVALDSVTADVTVTVTRFRATGSLAVPRSGHTATLLAAGQVLVTGGDALGSAEIYDPATGAFSAAGGMGVARRSGHAATRLANGRVLVTGGLSGSIEASAELYDPASGSFAPTGPMLHPRFNHTATILPDGKVLIVGGCCVVNAVGQYVDDEIYDPATGTFAVASPRVPAVAVFDHAAIRLANGDVLVTGGWRGAEPSSITAAATVFGSGSGLFTQVGSMQYRRQQPSAALLNDGRALIVGVTHGTGDWQREAELYDPVSATFTLTAATQMVDARSATTLQDGSVLVTGNMGGANPPTIVAAGSAERYDTGAGAFRPAGQMLFPRASGYTATRLLTGEVIFVGGTSLDGTATSSAELFW